jgi:sporulation protein YqfC
LWDILGLPSNAVTNGLQIEMAGNTHAFVDGCQGVIEYNDNTIKLASARKDVRFTGRNLRVRSMTAGSCVVEGDIHTVDFLN